MDIVVVYRNDHLANLNKCNPNEVSQDKADIIFFRYYGTILHIKYLYTFLCMWIFLDTLGYEQLPNTNCLHSDIATYYNNEKSLEACEQACDAMVNCVAFHYGENT